MTHSTMKCHFLGIYLRRKPRWSRYEDFIKGEDYIDKIPREVIIHDTYFKKVYGKGIEFVKADKEEPTAHLKNYIKNRAVEDLAPEIANSINVLGNIFLRTITPALEQVSYNLRTHVGIMKDMSKGIKEFNKTVKKLNDKLEQKNLNEWLNK